jgi:hypothetical protein
VQSRVRALGFRGAHNPRAEGGRRRLDRFVVGAANHSHEVIRMNKIAVVTLLICLAALAGCAAYPETPQERERQDRAEQQRRIDAMNRGP